MQGIEVAVGDCKQWGVHGDNRFGNRDTWKVRSVRIPVVIVPPFKVDLATNRRHRGALPDDQIGRHFDRASMTGKEQVGRADNPNRLIMLRTRPNSIDLTIVQFACQLGENGIDEFSLDRRSGLIQGLGKW